ncbi:hypothetical protein EHS13_16825 [Paenibacillus psychroresistens]|uniref:Uncharacterized protein n=1 Tax=Paenibacillus psychroresistens TaxID=1778678 RepID=A0A6B8RK62_9BACL|nr:hypothetical protein [Paenibacillus psychroresistens]QGQ96429.1 hypothetical protein EHS13_16825 [Paenibacillus psychroresistens]
MEHLYISIGFLLVGAILYKITDYPSIIYLGFSFWWAGWAWLVSWIIILLFDVDFSKLLGLSVLTALMAIFYGVKAILKHLKNNN